MPILHLLMILQTLPLRPLLQILLNLYLLARARHLLLFLALVHLTLTDFARALRAALLLARRALNLASLAARLRASSLAILALYEAAICELLELDDVTTEDELVVTVE